MKRLTDIISMIKLTKIIICISLCHIAMIGYAVAWDYSNYCGSLTGRKDYEIEENFDNDEVKAKAKEYQSFQTKYKNFCKKFENYLKELKKSGREYGGTKDFNTDVFQQTGFLAGSVEDMVEYKKRFDQMISQSPTFKKEYQELLAEEQRISKELGQLRNEQLKAHEEAKESGAYVPCGDKYPRGCPEGKQCFSKRTSLSVDETSIGSATFTSFDCLDPKDWNLGWMKAPKGSEGSGNSFETNIAGAYTKLYTDETGQTHVETNMQPSKPKECDIDGMRKQYQSKCYSCVIIKTLLETFLNACSKAYDITSEAGVKLLVLGALVWMAFFVMKNVSSLSNIEPGAMMNTLTVFLFKVMVAYILITSGLGVLVKYTINPLLTAGADMGIAYTSAVSYKSEAENFEYAVETPQVKAPTITTDGVSTEVVPAEVLNKVMLFAEKIDKNVSTNLVIGHAITCFSMEGGAWTFDILGIVEGFRIINLWLWFCGALIWFVGFMLTLGIGYYLLDISFKLGFSIMALPVVIGLWPFNVTKGKVTAVIGIMLKAAGTFVFLGLTTSYALAMISTALRDVDTLLDNIKNGNAQWVSETFELTGPYFLIILFAFLYSMKLISSTITDYVDKFFKDGVFGGADPMHKQLTQMTDFAKQQAMRPVKWAGGKASDAVKKQVTEGAAKAGKFVRGLFKGKANGDQEKDDKGGGNPVSGGGTAIKNTGKGAKAAGATMEQSGKGVQAAGKGVEAGGKAAQAGGKGLMSAGKGLSATGLGAIVGVPMMIAGAAAYGAGKGAEVAGKVTQKAGKAMQKGGKAMKKVGEKMEKAGEKMEKMGNKLKFGDEKAPEPENRDNRSSGEESSKPEEQNEPEKPEDNNKPDNGK